MELGITDFISSTTQLAENYISSGMTYAVDSLKEFMYQPATFAKHTVQKLSPNYESPYLKEMAKKEVKNNTKSRTTPKKPEWK